MNNALVFKGDDNIEVLKQVEALRLKVWSRLINQKTATTRFGLDRFDYEAWHVVFRDGKAIIGGGRLIVAADKQGVPDLCSFKPYLDCMEYPIGVMNRLLVHWMYQRKGIAEQINLKRIELARELGLSGIWVETRTSRVAPMQNLGLGILA